MASRFPILASTRCIRCHLPLKRSSISRTPRTWSRPISAYGYTQAKALVYSENGNPADVLSLHTHSLSPPHSNLLTLRTLTAPLNPADINQIQGTYPSSSSSSSSSAAASTSIGTPTPSTVPGNEACFEVLSTGSGVTTVQKGDWVIPRSTGLGTWRTHLQCPEDAVTRVVERGNDVVTQEGKTMMGGVSARQVGSVSVNPVTAWRLLRDYHSGAQGEGAGVEGGGGGWYIQNGANSGVGRVVSQLGRLWGLKGIAVVRKREEGMQALREEMVGLGAEKCVTDEEVNRPDFKERVAEWTDGGREEVKLGLNCVGGPEMAGMVKAMGKGATVVTYGAMSKKPLRVGAASLIFKDLRFVGFWVSRWAERFPEEKRRTVEEVLELYRQKKLVDVPYTDVPWEWNTKSEVLLEAVQGTLEGFRKGKGIFVFGDT